MSDASARLMAEGLRLSYGERVVVPGLDLAVLPGALTVIVGANASGKSTVLRGLARLHAPAGGRVLLDGKAISTMRTEDVARVLGVLPQAPVAPEGIVVADLVGRGRYPHQGWFRRWTEADEAAVAGALVATGMAELADRPVDALSGGQRQRVWIAMALAQETDLLLLDEPTTFLDISHQVEVLDLLTDLVRSRGRTVVAVLHDLNLACRYADHLVAVRDGQVFAEGRPGAIVSVELVERVFSLAAQVIPDPVSGTPMIVPIGRHYRTPRAMS